jgi:hypothetical protein
MDNKQPKTEEGYTPVSPATIPIRPIFYVNRAKKNSAAMSIVKIKLMFLEQTWLTRDYVNCNSHSLQLLTLVPLVPYLKLLEIPSAQGFRFLNFLKKLSLRSRGGMFTCTCVLALSPLCYGFSILPCCCCWITQGHSIYKAQRSPG